MGGWIKASVAQKTMALNCDTILTARDLGIAFGD
jgi:hypothetical protein